MSVRGSVYVVLGDIAERLQPRYYRRLDGYLRSARMGITYRAYMARTYLYALLVGLLVLIAVVGFVAAFAAGLGLPRESWLAPPLAALGFGYAVHAARVYYPRYVADVRAERIDATLPGVTSFAFALVRGGVPLAEVLDTVSSHPEVFGEAAEEFGVASREIDRFGGDVVTSLQRLAEETPSDEMSEFLKSFVSVVIRKEDLSGFLGEKAEEFHEDAEDRQESVLERLEVLAEFYVVVFVAAPLFVITILVVVGFVGAATLATLRAFVYLVMPVAGFGFVMLLDVLFEPPSQNEEEEDETPEAVVGVPSGTEVEGAEEEHEALDAYERRERLVEYLRRPVATLTKSPGASLRLAVGLGAAYVTAKAAVFFYLGGRIPVFESVPTLGFAFTETTERIVAAADDTVVEGAMVTLFVYAVLYQTRSEYLRDIEERLPELLGRLSSINQSGVPFLRSLVSLREVDLGVLNDQVDRMARDIELNSTASAALRRFERRAGSPAVTRTTVLLDNTAEASGRLTRVLEIAERDAKLRDRLARHRREQMSLYTVVIYVSFVVFIVIIAVLSTVFIPSPVGTAGMKIGRAHV